MTQLSTVTLRMQFMLPSQNFNAADAEVRRQFVTVMFSQGSAGPEPVRRVKHDGVIAGLDRAIGDVHVLAAVGVDAVGPDGFIGVGVNVDAVDHQPFATVGVDGPAWRMQEGEAGNPHVLAAAQQDHVRVFLFGDPFG